MKKRTMSFMLAFLMILSVTMPNATVFAKPKNDMGQEKTVKMHEDGSETMENVSYPIDSNKANTTEKQESKKEFDENEPFTLADIEGYSVEMDSVSIGVDHFKLECENNNTSNTPCTDLSFPSDVTSIQGGLLQGKVPPIMTNSKGQKHAYMGAYMGNVRIYYIGILHIKDEKRGQTDYIYYTTDTSITNKSVYAVLKDNEKITLAYEHGMDYTVDYQFEDSKGNKTEIGPDNWTLEQVFGTNRTYAVPHNHSFSTNVMIPRGYTATVTVKTKNDSSPVYTKTVGKMMEYEKNKTYPNLIELKSTSPTSMILSDNISIDNVNNDMIVVVKYTKVDTFTFNARMWTTTDYANGRIEVKQKDSDVTQNPSDSNSILKTDSHSFTWEFDGISSGVATWEMDQLQINGEAVRVPMTLLTATDSETETTTLSTGTTVTLTVKSLGGTNAKDGKRHYVLQIDNCYEDLTVSGGNMVGHAHKELALNTLIGVQNSEYWANRIMAGTVGTHWWEMEQDTLIDRRNANNNYNDPIRFQRKKGYNFAHVSFTTKFKEILQEDDESKDDKNYIEYLRRIDNGTGENSKGEYKTVPYSEWTPSNDGYFYLRGTKDLDDFMKSNDIYGVTLVNISANPIKASLDYKNGAGDGTNAPKAEDIENMPLIQNGGKDGYNVETNTKALISNFRPTDKSSKFVFDHWEVLKTEATEDGMGKLTNEVKKDENGNEVTYLPGEDLQVTDVFFSEASECLYYNKEKRAVFTLRAVWRTRGEQEAIPYIVRYILADLKDGQLQNETLIEEHTHTVNEGAMLVTDLYQDVNKTLSANIQAILGGQNNNQNDYTQEGKWVVYEPSTTMKIDSVTPRNNVATIYLVKKTTSVIVHKVWEDNNNQDGIRPKEIKVQLYAGDTPVGDKISLNDKNNWTYTFTDLNEYENGQEVQYTVNESDVPQGYSSKVTTDADNKNNITITNTKFPDLIISKEVRGDMGDKTKKFMFIVNVTSEDGMPITGEYSYKGSIVTGMESESTTPKDGILTFQNGKAEITLSHGQQIAIKNLPLNSTYTVEETNINGYTTTYNGQSGNATGTLDKTAIVNVVNTKYTVPDMGISDKNNGFEIFIGVGIVGILLVVCSIWCRRKRIKS